MSDYRKTNRFSAQIYQFSSFFDVPNFRTNFLDEFLRDLKILKKESLQISQLRSFLDITTADSENEKSFQARNMILRKFPELYTFFQSRHQMQKWSVLLLKYVDV